MRYRQFSPSEPASRFVECYWTLEDPGAGNAPVQRVVPDGTCELIVNRSRPCDQFQDGAWSLQPSVFFAGQITGPLLLRPTGPVDMLGIRFRPHGASHLLRERMDRLTGIMCPVSDLSPVLSRELERFGEPHPVDIGSIERALLKLDRSSPAPDPLAAEAVSQIVASAGIIDVGGLADRLGLSLRQLERRFRNVVGLPPKLFCRMQRFQKVFHAIDREAANWADVAAACGYFDQAHLVRDFRDFAGKPPTILLAEGDLARHFLRYHESVSHFSKTFGSTGL